ncbi:1-acylglycerol-3-phosphate O-acyltransferase [Phlyctochytrium bullatum]|nr:1-acylglycerol-3-phosphate O-acyltransferase [Phlyctochytrium bullatum]
MTASDASPNTRTSSSSFHTAFAAAAGPASFDILPTHHQTSSHPASNPSTHPVPLLADGSLPSLLAALLRSPSAATRTDDSSMIPLGLTADDVPASFRRRYAAALAAAAMGMGQTEEESVVMAAETAGSVKKAKGVGKGTSKAAKGNPGDKTSAYAKEIARPMEIRRTVLDIPLFILRQILFGQALATVCMYGGIMSAALVLVNKREQANSYIAWAMALLGSPACGVKAVVEGKEHLFGNRPAVGHMFPPDSVIMAKSDLKWVPFVGWYLWAANNLFIDRNNTRNALETMKLAAEQLEKKKMGLFMFPEGTRSHQTTNNMLPFKKGAFQIAVQGQMPIVPIVVGTYYDMYSSKEFYFRGGEMKIKVLPPIETTGLTVSDIDDLVERTRNQMVDTLREISKPVPKL